MASAIVTRARARLRSLLLSRYTIGAVLLVAFYLYNPALARRLFIGAILILGAILIPVLLYVFFHRNQPAD